MIDFLSKSSLFIFTDTWEAFLSENLKKDELLCGNMQNSQFSSKHLHCPFGVQGRSTREARRAEFLGIFLRNLQISILPNV